MGETLSNPDLEKAQEWKSPEEKAEFVMTPVQKRMSAGRERLEPIRAGYRENKMSKESGLSGTQIDLTEHGHEISVRQMPVGLNGQTKKPEYFYVAVIDGQQVNEFGQDPEGNDLARRLWEKYEPKITSAEGAFHTDKLEAQKAQHEVLGEARKYAESSGNNKEKARIIALDLLVDK